MKDIVFDKAVLIRASALRDGGTQMIYLMSNDRKFCLTYLGGFKYKKTSSYRTIILGGEGIEQAKLEEKYVNALEDFLDDNKSGLPENIYNTWKLAVTELKRNCG